MLALRIMLRDNTSKKDPCLSAAGDLCRPRHHSLYGKTFSSHTRWFKYDRDYVCVNKSQFVPVIFEPPCMYMYMCVCMAKIFSEESLICQSINLV
jgi:hypothetical protein